MVAVSSHQFKDQNLNVRVLNPRFAARLHLEMPFTGSKPTSLGLPGRAHTADQRNRNLQDPESWFKNPSISPYLWGDSSLRMKNLPGSTFKKIQMLILQIRLSVNKWRGMGLRYPMKGCRRESQGLWAARLRVGSGKASHQCQTRRTLLSLFHPLWST